MYKNPTFKDKGPPVRPPNWMFVDKPKHPSRGGNPWPIEIRNMVVSMHLNGDDLNSPRIARLRVRREFPSMRTVQRWLNRFNTKGTVHPMHATGDIHANQEVNGVNLVNVRAYVHNRN